MRFLARTGLPVMLVAVFLLAPAQAQVDTGDADFSTFVALGDSLVAGEVNSSLNEIFQDTSFPLLIWRQATGSASGFEQPLISDPGNGPRLILGPSFAPIPIPLPPGVELNRGLPRAFNNLGMVGGARVADLVPTSALNLVVPTPPITGPASCATHPLGALKNCDRFDLTLRDQGTTALEQAVGLDPTFVVLFVGGNDALQAAGLGTFDPVGLLTPTPAPLFEADYRTLVDEIIFHTGAGIAVATVPNVNVVPLLNTIPIDIDAGPPLGVVRLHGQDRGGPLENGDRITLFGQCYIEYGCGFGLPPTALGAPSNTVLTCSTPVPSYDCSSGQLPDQVVLNSVEAGQIQATIGEYNTSIRTIAEENGLALFDAEALLDEIAANGVGIGGVEYTVDFITGGIFSYDGFHPTPFTYAFIANGFIDAINETYNANIPPVDLYPFMFEESSGGIAPLPNVPTPTLGPPTLSSISWSLGLPGGAIGTGDPGEIEPEKPKDPRSREIDRRQRRFDRVPEHGPLHRR